jgi:hypothetical protein
MTRTGLLQAKETAKKAAAAAASQATLHASEEGAE